MHSASRQVIPSDSTSNLDHPPDLLRTVKT
jgi:hypothetical protein